MGKFDGKRLLELGTSVSSVDIVRYARAEGAYVIVTDYLDKSKSEAKQYADECAMVSTMDIDAVCRLAAEKNVDCVFSGVSEINTLAAKKVADRMGFPYYFSWEQWNTVMNKLNFKHLCIAHGVPVPEEFVIEDIDSVEQDTAIQYPVIVKPVDSSSAAGVHICRDAQELKAGYLDAKAKSQSGSVVVEKYITGQEISAYFVFVKGEGRLSFVADRHTCKQDRGYTPLPEAFIMPSKYTGKFAEEISEKMISMFKSIGFDSGVIGGVQGIANDDGIFMFECSMRLTGYRCYTLLEKLNGNNYMKLMADKVILDSAADYDLTREDPILKGKYCCVLTLLNGGGVVGSIEGCEDVRKFDGIIDLEQRYFIGDEITKNGTLKQTHFQVFMICDTITEMKALIEKVKSTIQVRDINGNNMIYSDFNTALI